MERIIGYIASILVVLLVIPVHEFAHAYVAVKSGDPTPKLAGRYTINPIKHFDLVGLLMMIVVHFGWAKPVPVNPYNFKNLRRDYFLVSIAGITVNLIMAFIFALLLVVFCNISYAGLGLGVYSNVTAKTLYLSFASVATYLNQMGRLTSLSYVLLLLLYYVLLYGVFININLFAFNLIPVFPLDGFRILECILPQNKPSKVLEFLRKYGYYVLLALLIWSAVCSYLVDYIPLLKYTDILGIALSFVDNLFFGLFTGFWGLFF